MIWRQTNCAEVKIKMIFYVVLLLVLLIAFSNNEASQPSPILSSFPHAIMSSSHILLAEREQYDRSYTTQFRTIRPASYTILNQYPLASVDQGPWASCTAFAVRYALLLWQKTRDLSISDPSVAYWYAKARMDYFKTTTLQDTGTTLSSLVNSLNTWGILESSAWSYSAQNVFLVPPRSLDANLPKFSNFQRLTRKMSVALQIEDLKSHISQNRAIVCSFLVYSNGMTSAVLRSGEFPMPKGSVRGGHAVCIVGYDETNFLILNSWGPYTGTNGLFKIPATYIANSKFAGEWFAF